MPTHDRFTYLAVRDRLVSLRQHVTAKDQYTRSHVTPAERISARSCPVSLTWRFPSSSPPGGALRGGASALLGKSIQGATAADAGGLCACLLVRRSPKIAPPVKPTPHRWAVVTFGLVILAGLVPPRFAAAAEN